MNELAWIPQSDTLFMIMLAFFTLATSLLSLMTVLNALRLRNVRMTWRAGKLRGFPLFSTIFLSFIALTVFTAWFVNETTSQVALACYGWMGINWFVASYLMSKRYITDHGIVKNINDPSQTIAWHQINDFVEREEPGKDLHKYSFFYVVDDQKNGIPKQSVRLKLDVPSRQASEFQRILSHKLGRRFNCYTTHTADIKQYNADE
ncbi:MAG: hypothetical protein ACQETE_15865 [Bacteroidota bacterium]